MLKWIVLLVLVGAIAGVVVHLRKAREIVVVGSPVDRVFVYQKNVRRKAPLGFYQGLHPEPITGRGRTVEGKSYLTMGTHSFMRGVSVARCSAGQHAITFWSHDDVAWKPPKGATTQGPIPVMTADQIPAMVALRVSYSIVDEPTPLLSIGTPDVLAERAIGDVLVSVRETIGQRESLNYATIDRKDLSQELSEIIADRLKKRGLLLRDLWLGHITFDADVQAAIKAHFNARTTAMIPQIAATGQAMANSVLARSVTPELIELIRAERSGNPWNHWAAHLAELENSTKSLQR